MTRNDKSPPSPTYKPPEVPSVDDSSLDDSLFAIDDGSRIGLVESVITRVPSLKEMCRTPDLLTPELRAQSKKCPYVPPTSRYPDPTARIPVQAAQKALSLPKGRVEKSGPRRPAGFDLPAPAPWRSVASVGENDVTVFAVSTTPPGSPLANNDTSSAIPTTGDAPSSGPINQDGVTATSTTVDTAPPSTSAVASSSVPSVNIDTAAPSQPGQDPRPRPPPAHPVVGSPIVFHSDGTFDLDTPLLMSTLKRRFERDDESQKEIKRLKKVVANKENALDQRAGNLQEKHKSIVAKDGEIRGLNLTITDLRINITTERDTSKDLRKDLREANATIDSLKKQLRIALALIPPAVVQPPAVPTANIEAPAAPLVGVGNPSTSTANVETSSALNSNVEVSSAFSANVEVPSASITNVEVPSIPSEIVETPSASSTVVKAPSAADADVEGTSAVIANPSTAQAAPSSPTSPPSPSAANRGLKREADTELSDNSKRQRTQSPETNKNLASAEKLDKGKGRAIDPPSPPPVKPTLSSLKRKFDDDDEEIITPINKRKAVRVPSPLRNSVSREAISTPPSGPIYSPISFSLSVLGIDVSELPSPGTPPAPLLLLVEPFRPSSQPAEIPGPVSHCSGPSPVPTPRPRKRMTFKEALTNQRAKQQDLAEKAAAGARREYKQTRPITDEEVAKQATAAPIVLQNPAYSLPGLMTPVESRIDVSEQEVQEATETKKSQEAQDSPTPSTPTGITRTPFVRAPTPGSDCCPPDFDPSEVVTSTPAQYSRVDHSTDAEAVAPTPGYTSNPALTAGNLSPVYDRSAIVEGNTPTVPFPGVPPMLNWDDMESTGQGEPASTAVEAPIEDVATHAAVDKGTATTDEADEVLPTTEIQLDDTLTELPTINTTRRTGRNSRASSRANSREPITRRRTRSMSRDADALTSTTNGRITRADRRRSRSPASNTSTSNTSRRTRSPPPTRTATSTRPRRVASRSGRN